MFCRLKCTLLKRCLVFPAREGCEVSDGEYSSGVSYGAMGPEFNVKESTVQGKMALHRSTHKTKFFCELIKKIL